MYLDLSNGSIIFSLFVLFVFFILFPTITHPFLTPFAFLITTKHCWCDSFIGLAPVAPVSFSWLVVGILEALVIYVILRLFFSAVCYFALSNIEFHFMFYHLVIHQCQPLLLSAVVFAHRFYQIKWKLPMLTLYSTFNSSLLKKSQFTELPIDVFADSLQLKYFCCCPNRSLVIDLPFFSS